MNLDSITQLTGIIPTFSCKKGDINTVCNGKREVKASNDSWIYDIETDDYSEELLESFLDKFSGCTELFASLREKDIIPYLVITYYVDDYRKVISIPTRTVNLISKLQLERCIDIMKLDLF